MSAADLSGICPIDLSCDFPAQTFSGPATAGKIGLENIFFFLFVFCHFKKVVLEMGRLEGPAEGLLFLSIEMHGKWLLHFRFHCKGKDNGEVDGPLKVLYIHACATAYAHKRRAGAEKS